MSMEGFMPQEVHYEKDKRLIPYLIACQPLVSFIGVKSENSVVYFGFSPTVKVLELISQFFTNQGPTIPAKKLFEAVDEFRTILYREKDKANMGYGGIYGGNYGQRNK